MKNKALKFLALVHHGQVVQTFGTRLEADKANGAKLRVVQVSRDLQAGHRVSQTDMANEICRGLPSRGLSHPLFVSNEGRIYPS